MGSMNRRLELLEDASRESAAADVRAAWMGLADEEMALLVAPTSTGASPRRGSARRRSGPAAYGPRS